MAFTVSSAVVADVRDKALIEVYASASIEWGKKSGSI